MGAYFNGVKLGIPYHEHEWMQGMIDGVKLFTPPPDVYSEWAGTPNASESYLFIRIPHNKPTEVSNAVS